MKKYNIFIFIVFSVLCFAGISVAAELQNGFMGYRWGDSIAKYAELTELSSQGDITYYSNPGESYSMDDISVDDVVYGFYHGRLFAVYIGIDALETYDRIMVHMKLKYGLPDTKTSVKDRLTTIKWKYRDVVIKLKTDELGGRMKLAFYYRPLLSDLKNDQIDQISETSYRFFPIDKNKKPKMIPFLEF